MYNNPILNSERLYLQQDLSYNFTNSSTNEKNIVSNNEKTFSLWKFIIMIINFLKSLISSKENTSNTQQIEPIEESTQIEAQNQDISSVVEDSDFEILGERNIITNDYHFINKIPTNDHIKENSILIDYDSFQQQSPPAEQPVKPHQNSSSQLLKELALRKLKNQISSKSSQYGTNLSIAKPVRYNHSRQRKGLIPDESRSNSMSQRSPDSDNLLDISPTISNYQQSILNYYIPSKPISVNKYSIVDDLISNLRSNKLTSAYESSQSKIQDIITKRRLASLSKITPLSDDQLLKVQNIWRANPRNVLLDKYSIELTTGDLQTLQDGRWLNDNVIDYYFNVIMKENPKVFGWTTHFYSTLQQKGYQGVSRWAKRKKIDVFSKDKILVPVNISNTHWALSVIDNLKKTIIYYDSLSMSGNPQAVENLKMYMDKEAERLGKSKMCYELISHFDSPQQNNGSDCGVFTCTAAKYISKDKNLDYSQNDMKLIRRSMVYEMINDKLL
ncbi:uncharacterized protein KGF55_000207 [Candida pseudojiufengensis]|uniref:uncharacterized protein n=1 Tax=Candida pseudojiufengensis TaxID=497109 RepID=UPI002224118B|nr:uncharacterized protein KGF55_000207 [Candida pseudojiufengensis]KAI5966798.1 hypothetical protein KGF55_000207 [Candida pseudojiufengensis]